MGKPDLQKVLDGIPSSPVKIFVSPRGIGFCYSYKGIGFGEVFISLADGATARENEYPLGRLNVDSECSSKEFVKRVIFQAIDESDFH